MAVLQFPRPYSATRELRTASPRVIRHLFPASIEPQVPVTNELIWGIASRSALRERLEVIGELAPAAQLSFLAVEVSGLYAVNPSPADSTPETLLFAVANSVRGLTRATDVVGRLTASSFGVVLQGMGETAAGAVAARLSLHLNQLAVRWPGSKVRVSAATGTGVNALVLPSAAMDTSAKCC